MSFHNVSTQNLMHFIDQSPQYVWSFFLLMFSVSLQCLWLVSFKFFLLFTKSKHYCLNAADIFLQKSGKAQRKPRILLDTWALFLNAVRGHSLRTMSPGICPWPSPRQQPGRIRLIFIISKSMILIYASEMGIRMSSISNLHSYVQSS